MQLPTCPKCDARMSPSPDGDELWCQFCGAIRRDETARQLVQQYHAAAPPTKYDPPKRDWEMPGEERRALDMAWECIQEGDRQTARIVLEEALFGKRHTFADAWYLLSLTTDDPDQKLRYLETALTIQPYHDYAWRDKGVLEGVIPNADHPTTPEPGAVDTVDVISETQDCPVCTGLMAFDVALGALICGSCGYRPDVGVVTLRSYDRYDKLENALLQRRYGFSKEWRVGSRLLVCQNCHAQLTLTHTALKTQCPFCDSAHVLVQDTVGSFEEPDAILPFKLDRQQAAKALHKRLPLDLRGQIERGEMWGVYLPFWSFRGLVSVMVPPGTLVPPGIRLGAFSIEEAVVGGIEKPDQAVLYELMPYDLDALVPYDPRYLGGQWAAQVYSIDVVQASITARAYAKYIARQTAVNPRYTPPPMDLARTDSNAYNPPDTPFWRVADVVIEGMNYRLQLLPVWMITLVMRNGSRCPAIVNGQTGEALLSASFVSPETIIAGPGRAPVEPLPLVVSAAPPTSSVIRPLAPLD
ncbi:MAG: hypothetical protein JXA10_14905 [Anaerolineae bacterium]|nr:hypothetical protein [Anaerolineae bacterium]